MTRTAAADYHGDVIHMNNMDTGWVRDEDPVEIAARKVAERRFHTPLDIVDGAARIVDPIIAGVNSGEHVHGTLLRVLVPLQGFVFTRLSRPRVKTVGAVVVTAVLFAAFSRGVRRAFRHT